MVCYYVNTVLKSALGPIYFYSTTFRNYFWYYLGKIMNWKIICPRKFQFSKTRNLNVFHHNNTPLNIVQSKYYFLCPQRKIYIFHSLRDDRMIILYCNNANTRRTISIFKTPEKITCLTVQRHLTHDQVQLWFDL